MRCAGLALCVLLFGCTRDNAPGLLADLGDDAMSEVPCGNGVLDENETCDDGNLVNGDGCQTDCTYTCVSNERCSDGDACTGVETCVDHVCQKGTLLGDGESCGTGRICKGGGCVDAQCGDLITTTPEECDDGNVTNGDGCDVCRFSCKSNDATRNCTPADPCMGQGTCNDTTHLCAAGTPIADGLPCPGMPARYCKTGVCTMPVCNNGTPEPGEICDDGNTSDTDGCKQNCTFTCANPGTDCAAPPDCQMQTCNASHVCLAVADASKNGQDCGANGSGNKCMNGACLPPGSVCNNGVKEAGEDCDLGAGNGAGLGCETTCKFSCTISPNSCDDANPCNGVETCVASTMSGQTIQKCNPGTALPVGTACGAGNICLGGSCRVSSCGDGYVDAGRSEQCEPPGSATCSASCTNIVCGDGKREGNEQCDDSNTTNLDGCDATCKFEQAQRVVDMVMQFSTDTFCGANQLGAAIVNGTAQAELQTSLDNGVDTGETNVLFKLYDLEDLTGTADPMVRIGVLGGTVVSPGTTVFDGNATDLDWWFTADPLSIDATRTPTAILTGSIAGQKLTTTPGNVTLLINLGGSAASLRMSNTKVEANSGAASTPRVSSNGMTPGHLTSENLNPALTSFATSGPKSVFNMSGARTTVAQGKLCGHVSAASLDQVNIPDALVGSGCNGRYTDSNTLLDVLVGGCNRTVFIFTVTVIAATQPDQNDPDVAPVGSGPAYRLFTNGTTRRVDRCQDSSGATVNLAQCLADAAYSSYFRFGTQRVIIK